MRPLAAWIALLIVTLTGAETLLTEAKVLKAEERGFILQVGTQPLAVEDSYLTKFWRSKAPAKRDDFSEGDAVWTRIKTDADPPQLREISDRETAAWLQAIRTTFKKGTVEKLDAKYLTLKFEDGSSFAYRATESSKVLFKGKATSLSDVEEGMAVYAKGRLLPTLDTFLAELTDTPPPPTAAKETKSKPAKMSPLQPTGLLEGTVNRSYPELSMFDIETDRLLHITYTAATKFTLDGQPASKAAIRRNLRARITYRRDKAGRILASKVDLFSG